MIHHRFDLTPSEAEEVQERLASSVIVEDRLPEVIRTIGGVDVAYDEVTSTAVAAITVLDVSTLNTVTTVTGQGQIDFPYIPGLFSFRELPALARAMDQLDQLPDIVICDGHGIAHPRRFGLACHLGVLYNVPTIGCAKTRLVGEAGDCAPKRGDSAPLTIGSETVGIVLRTQDNVKPVYVSPGHLISAETACMWVLRTSRRYRLPEPIRAANNLVNTIRAARRRE
jgi:deoxyribonuclease V